MGDPAVEAAEKVHRTRVEYLITGQPGRHTVTATQALEYYGLIDDEGPVAPNRLSGGFRYDAEVIPDEHPRRF